jgi:hypothetical protein
VHPHGTRRYRELRPRSARSDQSSGRQRTIKARRHLIAGRGARALLAAIPLAFGAWCLSAGGGVAHADPIGSCTTTSGVVIVVDFSAWGGAVNRQCYPNITASTTAYSAMNTEGFTTQGDNHDGDAFVCRINDLPSPAQDPCDATPPASAYWAFWIANSGQANWSVSQAGAMSLAPKPGSTELWKFGSSVSGSDQSNTPSFPPSAVAATDPVPPTTAPPAVTTVPPHGSAGSGATSDTNATGSGAGATGKSAAGIHTTIPLKSSGTTGAPAAAGKTTPAQRAGVAATHSPASALHIVDAAPASSQTHHTSGSPVALLIGGVVVLALASGALMVVLRRRRLE